MGGAAGDNAVKETLDHPNGGSGTPQATLKPELEFDSLDSIIGMDFGGYLKQLTDKRKEKTWGSIVRE